MGTNVIVEQQRRNKTAVMLTYHNKDGNRKLAFFKAALEFEGFSIQENIVSVKEIMQATKGHSSPTEAVVLKMPSGISFTSPYEFIEFLQNTGQVIACER